VVLESIFALPGLGTLLLDSVIRKDFTQLQGLVLFFSVIIIMINIAVDLSYAWFDPRIRYS
jgi:peptide/nickel transport system permease protein